MCAKRRIAIKWLAAVTLAATCVSGFAAQVAGTVVNLSGPLMVRKASGAVKVLGLKAEVEQGDTLVAEKNTYARIRFVDNSEITLKPNTTFRVEAFAYEEAKPDADSASFTLVKGGLRSVSGMLGKRNREKFQLRTPSATIGIRGTTFTADYIGVPLPNAPRPGAGALAPGLYVAVMDGLIHVVNPAGAQSFAAGQFGFVPSTRTPPVLVPTNPGLQFTPPPAFSTLGPLTATSTLRSNVVDCEVR